MRWSKNRKSLDYWISRHLHRSDCCHTHCILFRHFSDIEALPCWFTL